MQETIVLIVIFVVSLCLLVLLNWHRQELLRAGLVALMYFLFLFALPCLGMLLFSKPSFQISCAAVIMAASFILLRTGGYLERILDRFLKG